MKTDTYLKKHPSQSSHKDPNKFFRTKRFSMRMSPDEFAQLEKNYLKSDENSMASFARKILTSDEIKSVKKDESLVLLLNATNKIGNNINQIARQLNTRKNEILSTGMTDDIEDCKTILLNIQQDIQKMKVKKAG